MTDQEHPGAMPEDWDLFWKLAPGDLLPVVSNPDSEISQKSKITAKGKVPSIYNQYGKITGIVGWTTYKVSRKSMEQWRRFPDYGICVRTGRASTTILSSAPTIFYLGIDIDVENKAISRSIVEYIELLLTRSVCKRGRKSTGSCLIPIKIVTKEGEIVGAGYQKRRLKVKGGYLELLADGQQFVAAGTHPKGERYEWDWRDHEPQFVVMTPEEFEALWQKLVLKFGEKDELHHALTPTFKVRRRDGTDAGVVKRDSTAAALRQNGLALDTGRDGELWISCPWKHEHSMDSGPSETAYFPAGVRGYEQGHFKCLHAHCAGRGDGDFIQALGLVADKFEIIEEESHATERNIFPEKLSNQESPVTVAGGSADDGQRGKLLSSLKQNGNGEFTACLDNVCKVLAAPPVLREVIAWDNFRDEMMRHPVEEDGQWRRFEDDDYTRLRRLLECQGFKAVSHDMMRDALLLVARGNRIDTAVTWLEALEWDGVGRVKGFFENYCGSDRDAYSRAVGVYMWSAMAGRVMCGRNGCKADMAPILIGAQGIGKSSAVAAIAPDDEFYISLNLMDRDADMSRQMRGKLLIEFGELRGLRNKDIEAVKEFITRQFESWIPKYQELPNKYARRCLFIGTTNEEEFLSDKTGNRRWLPLHCKEVDVPGIVRDRNQLWAEARELFNLSGVVWEEAERLAKDHHEKHTTIDTWEEDIEAWLHTSTDVSGSTPADLPNLRTRDILENALRLSSDKIANRQYEMRLGPIMRTLGYSRIRRREGKIRPYFWKKD